MLHVDVILIVVKDTRKTKNWNIEGYQYRGSDTYSFKMMFYLPPLLFLKQSNLRLLIGKTNVKMGKYNEWS